MMLKQAFKEWAVIARALAEGRQSIVLRKGGVAEAGDAFAPEHRRFWLYPTRLHQKLAALKLEAAPLFAAADHDRPPHGMVRLSHFAEVEAVHDVTDLDRLLRLEPLHLWTQETVRSRFVYRRPGLFVLAVRVFGVVEPFDVPETAHYAGCKSWVELDHALPTAAARPVLDDHAFGDVVKMLDLFLQPGVIV